ncbi:MAG: hypothetical protein FWG16_06655 [Micrococcales bacterium]|nr:hypothetical protein [Micrococcales bacterium]
MPQAARASLGAICRVKERWRRASSEGGWRVAEDWFAPPIDRLIVACLSAAASAQWLEAAEALGLARGQAGVGIDETIADISCFAATASPTESAPTPWDLSRAVARGWSRGAAAAITSESVRDPASGLGTVGYLAARLEETYQRAATKDQDVSQTHYLLLIDTEVEGGGPIHHFIRATGLGQALRQIFPAGEPLACLNQPAAVGVALVPTRQEPEALMARLRVRLTRQFAALSDHQLVRLPPYIWVLALPSNYDEALDLLASIARCRPVAG